MKQLERIVWMIVLAVAIVFGFLKRDMSTDGASVHEISARSSRGGQAARMEHGDAERPRRTVGQGGHQSHAGEKSLQALRSEDPLLRMAGFLKLIASCDANGIAEVQAAVAGLRSSGVSLPAEEDLMNFRAGQLKGAELMADKTGAPGDLMEMGSLKKQYEGWVQADPQAASNWLEGLQPGKFRDQMALSYIAGSAKNHPMQALKVASSLHPSQQIAAGRTSGEKWFESASLADASALLETIGAEARTDDHLYLESIFDALVSKATQSDDPTAVALVESHLDQPYVGRAALAKISHEKGKADPVAALEWALNLEARKQHLNQGAMLSAAVDGMTLEGLDRAEEWTAAHLDRPGVQEMWITLQRKRGLLEDDRGENPNDYDQGD